MDIMKKAAVDVDMHIALWTERPRLGPATWQQAELYWLTPAPLVTIKPCHHQALCPLLVLMSENFSQVKGQLDFRRKLQLCPVPRASALVSHA